MSVSASLDALFCDFLRTHPCRGLLIALSGGADSVALLHLAYRHRDALGYRLEALHVHHGIRGSEADRDRQFCRTLCARLDIPLTVIEYDIPALSATEKAGLEETARKYRYRALDECAAAHGLDRIATAHTATDNLETVILQLTRGAGSLIGIPPVRGAYLRPLLSATKADILHYLDVWNLPHVEDSSNESDDYSRNLIRHRVLPVLQQLNPKAEEAFGRAISLSREDNAYLDALSTPAAQSGDVAQIAALPLPLRTRALIARCEQLGIGQLSHTHLEALTKLVENAVPHSALSLPGGSVAIEEGVLVRNEKRNTLDAWKIELQIGENRLPDGSILYLSREDEDEFKKYITHQQNIYKLLINVTLNFATIEGRVIARARNAGDRILCGKMHRSVKKLYCDAHLPLSERPYSPLICDQNGILWIPALGMIRDGLTESIEAPLHLYWFKEG